MDIFNHTNCAQRSEITLLAIIKRPVFYAYIPKDDRTKNIEPSLATVGFGVYGKYLFTMTAAYCLMVFTIEYLSFADIEEILIMGMASAVFTFLILLGIDSLITNSEKSHLWEYRHRIQAFLLSQATCKPMNSRLLY